MELVLIAVFKLMNYIIITKTL